MSHPQRDSVICPGAKQIKRILFNSKSSWARQRCRQHLRPYVCWKNTDPGLLPCGYISAGHVMSLTSCATESSQAGVLTLWKQEGMFQCVLIRTFCKRGGEKGGRDSSKTGTKHKLGIEQWGSSWCTGITEDPQNQLPTCPHHRPERTNHHILQ